MSVRLATIENKSYLSWMRQSHSRTAPAHLGISELFDLSYQNRTRIQADNSTMRLNFHEFNHIENGRKMLVITEGVKYLDLVEIGLPYKTYSVFVTGFQEVDSKTGKVLFEWDSVPRVSLGETSLMPERTGPTLDESEAFDFM